MNNVYVRIRKGVVVQVYIIIHNDIQYKTRIDLSLPNQQYESIFIEVEPSIFSTSKNTIVGEIYKPSSSKFFNFIKTLKTINTNKTERKYAVIMGDYNIDTLSETNNNSKSTQDFINIFSTYYYHKLINYPTRERNQSGSLIVKQLYRYSRLLQHLYIWCVKVFLPIRSLSRI